MILTLTMVVFILPFRSQNVAIRDAAYQKALDDYTASISMLVQNPGLGEIMEDLGREVAPGSSPLGEKNRTVFGYMLLNYSLFERVYLLHAKKWIDEDTWRQWYAWIKTMAKHPIFQEVHRRSQGTFDRGFQSLMDEASGPGPEGDRP